MRHARGKHRGTRPRQFGPLLTDRVCRVVAVIPVHNEIDQITGTIEAVQRQTRQPDEIYILIDNSEDRELADDVAEKVMPYDVIVTQTAANEYLKAGNLNIALAAILPGLDDTDVITGFDADSRPSPEFIENAITWVESGYGSVGATFHGRRGGGLLGTLQRAEFARFAQHQHRRPRADVLSGTGWCTRVCVLWALAATRADGMVYDVHSMVEDYELTLALKRMGIPILAPGNCRVLTDVMESLRDWHSQRLRWQHGTLTELRSYGWAPETRGMIIRQSVTYLGMVMLPLTTAYLVWSFLLFGWEGINPANAPLYAACLGFIIMEQTWQARKAGWAAMAATLLIFPDLLYSVARQFVYARAGWRFLRGKRAAGWGAGTSK
jgi:cellulose synthase/poly-beta-1,6-N-acetylglucosamine synthase-like glycosyltransferase